MKGTFFFLKTKQFSTFSAHPTDDGALPMEVLAVCPAIGAYENI